LSETKITDLKTLHAALHRLHTEYSLPHIVISSIPLPYAVANQLVSPPPSAYTALLPDPLPAAYHPVSSETPEILVCVASSWTEEGGMRTWAYGLPTIDVPFTGTGDLLSALCAAWFDVSTPSPLADAVAKALLTVQQILLKTHIHALSAPTGSSTDTRATATTLRQRELRLIPERALIASPGDGWTSTPIDWSTL
jgi:pyridoxine kinase